MGNSPHHQVLNFLLSKAKIQLASPGLLLNGDLGVDLPRCLAQRRKPYSGARGTCHKGDARRPPECITSDPTYRRWQAQEFPNGLSAALNEKWRLEAICCCSRNPHETEQGDSGLRSVGCPPRSRCCISDPEKGAVLRNHGDQVEAQPVPCAPLPALRPSLPDLGHDRWVAGWPLVRIFTFCLCTAANERPRLRSARPPRGPCAGAGGSRFPARRRAGFLPAPRPSYLLLLALGAGKRTSAAGPAGEPPILPALLGGLDWRRDGLWRLLLLQEQPVRPQPALYGE